MVSHSENNDARSIGNFTALKTAIANGEEQLIRDLLPTEPMIDIEKSYLIELAKLNSNSTIIELLEGIPIKK